jgi:FkbM family methyltransferase
VGWRALVYNTLNRPGGRFILATAATAYASAKARRRCRVFYDRAWVHEYADSVIVEPKMNLLSPSQIEEMTEDFWTYQSAPGPGDVVVDVGAGTGWETLYFSRRVGASGRVISVEAHPRIYSCLEDMSRRNRLANVTLLNCAVAAEEGTAIISDCAAHLANSIVGKKQGMAVRARTLDEIAASLQLFRVDLLKMNIEGAERMAIAGMSDVIRKTRYVCIACHDFLADRGGPTEMRTKSTVLAFLRQNGFDIVERESCTDFVRDLVYGSNPGLNGLCYCGMGPLSSPSPDIP